MDEELMQSQQPQPGSQDQGEQLGQSEQLEDGQIEATDQEQQMLEQAMGLSLEIIHGEGPIGDQVAKMVLENQDVTVGIGGATSAVLIATEKKAGGLPDDLKIQLALEIVAELSGLAVEAGALSEEEVDDSFIDGVVSNAYTSYLSTKESMGELDPSELEKNVVEAERAMGTSVRGEQQPGQQQQQPQQPPQSSSTDGGLMSMGGGA